ncbi:hypothetical protein VT84_01920 [Gemmata sp. SH-PL17]|uniref:hypothetical protein n=1 Tax=Gemmata sp. SH-PL17 TaxID=1630693 RepID=UPI00078D1FE0|nr:hypothetical protein [Gemmata sp. SH-PL17]AMV23138.1 hypothetical protein VT84_01920 [Gemmata sp. SH-PL17]
MASQNELHALQQQISRLSLGDQLRLIEMVLADVRHAHFTDHDAARQEISALEEWHSMQQRLTGRVGGAEREAG